MSDREQFEAWVTSQGHALGYAGDGHYDIWVVARWWEAWQAARAQSSTSNQVEVGTTVQAGQMLTDDEIALVVADCSASAHRQDDFSFARAIEQAVLAKRVPMTEAQIEHALRSEPMADSEESFVCGIRAAERHHGIVGEKGGA